jgi:hypothetical protein
VTAFDLRKHPRGIGEAARRFGNGRPRSGDKTCLFRKEAEHHAESARLLDEIALDRGKERVSSQHDGRVIANSNRRMTNCQRWTRNREQVILNSEPRIPNRPRPCRNSDGDIPTAPAHSGTSTLATRALRRAPAPRPPTPPHARMRRPRARASARHRSSSHAASPAPRACRADTAARAPATARA